MDALSVYRDQILRAAARAGGKSPQNPLYAEAQLASAGSEAAIHALPVDFTDMATIEGAHGVLTLMLDFDGLDSAPLG